MECVYFIQLSHTGVYWLVKVIITFSIQTKSAFLKAIKADVLFIEPVLCLAEIYDRQQNTAKAIEL